MLDHCSKWQHDFNGYSDDADHVSSIWIKELIANLLDPELKKQVSKNYSKLEGYQQGDITFFKITMDTVLKMSIMAKESLKSSFRILAKMNWPRYQMRTCNSFLVRLMELLSG
jgi:hypothetical protein